MVRNEIFLIRFKRVVGVYVNGPSSQNEVVTLSNFESNIYILSWFRFARRTGQAIRLVL